jgi:hypothetical protein
MAQVIESIMQQSLADAVYWFDVNKRTPRRVSLHAAPINVGEGLKKYLFDKLPSVVLTSATLCTGKVTKSTTPQLHQRLSQSERITGYQPVSLISDEVNQKQGAYLPHWTRNGAIYSITFRLHDSLPKAVLEAWIRDREAIKENARSQHRALTPQEEDALRLLYTSTVNVMHCWHGA